MRYGAVLFLWAWTNVAWADIEVKPIYEIGEPIVVKVQTDMPEGAVIRGGTFECDGAQFVQVAPTTFHVWAAPGTYKIEVWGKWKLTKKITDKDGTDWEVTLDDDMYHYKKSFTVAGEVPVPVPPQPDPPTPPGARSALIIEETSKTRTPQVGNLILALRKEFTDSRLRVVDQTQLPPSLQKYNALLKPEDPLPQLFVLTDAGAVVRHVPLPSSVADVKKEISK
jgi:hypothetical protein